MLLIESKSELDETPIDSKVSESLRNGKGKAGKSARACFSLISKKILCISGFREIWKMKKVAK
jgi:hypothetical protein